MSRSRTLVIILASVVLLVVAGILFFRGSSPLALQASDEGAIHSPYAGQESRGIKALSQEDIAGLLAGAGTPFGGMAKPAELNGYPGPRHVLDAVEAGEFELAAQQQAQVEALYEEMRAEAIALGEQIVAIEKGLDDAFHNGTISEAVLREKVSESAGLYGQLRFVHLKFHLAMVDVLTPQQVAQYNELRGYAATDPCANVPEGHDAELWRLHNNCD